MFKKTLLAALILGGVQAQAFDLSKVTTGGKIEASIFHTDKQMGVLDMTMAGTGLVSIDSDQAEFVAMAKAHNIALAYGGGTAAPLKAYILSAHLNANADIYGCSTTDSTAGNIEGGSAKLGTLNLINTAQCDDGTNGKTIAEWVAADTTVKAFEDYVDAIDDFTKMNALDTEAAKVKDGDLATVAIALGAVFGA